MSAQRFELITASLAGAIDAWYNATIDGDTAIITLGAWAALMAGLAAVVTVALFGRYWLGLLRF